MAPTPASSSGASSAEAAPRLRLFFALWPPRALQDELARWAGQAAGRGRVMRRENIHLTLAFLGDTDAALLMPLRSAAQQVAFAPIQLRLDRVQYWKHNRIIWCGSSAEPDALIRLVAALRAALSAAGVRYDPKPFVSHLTLVRQAQGMQGAPPWLACDWNVGEFVLVHSARCAGGVRYEVLARFGATT